MSASEDAYRAWRERMDNAHRYYTGGDTFRAGWDAALAAAEEMLKEKSQYLNGSRRIHWQECASALSSLRAGAG